MIRIVAILGLLCVAPAAWAQHYHLNAGVLSQAPGSPLSFPNSGQFGTNSGFALPLTFKTNGAYAGYHQSGALTFTAIGTGFPNASAPGTQVRLRFVSVSGPAGGRFGVWDVEDIFGDDVATSIAFEVPVGTVNGTNFIQLSQNNGEPGADPFGHVHGRQLSATAPGLYVVTVQAYDASTNGPGGNPIHTASDLLPLYFQAGDTIGTPLPGAGQVDLLFGTKLGADYYVEATSNPADANSWTTIAGPITGNDHLQAASDSITALRRFYRLRLVPSP